MEMKNADRADVYALYYAEQGHPTRVMEIREGGTSTVLVEYVPMPDRDPQKMFERDKRRG